jgi:hypothetical protein
MSEKVEIDLQGNSHWRVALDLAVQIANHDSKGNKNDRAYWLDLYHQCHRVVYRGADAQSAKK